MHRKRIADFVFFTQPGGHEIDSVKCTLDRFLFIREIFDGDQEKYNEAIFRLNSAANLDEANIVVSGYTQEDTDADVVKQLMDLLKRKFRSNE